MSAHGTEIVIIGGGSAGLSAALTLARARRRVLVIDDGEPRNAPAEGAHGLLGLEGINPLALLQKGREEVASYGGKIIHARVTDARPADEGFRISTDTDGDILARTVLIATGTRDQLPDIPGLRERWGKDVIHCPYYHGWETRDQRIGVLATGPMSALQALMFSQWSSDIRFFPQGLDYTDGDFSKLAVGGIRIDRRKITGIDSQGNRLAGVRLDDGSTIPLDALVVPTLTRARLDGLENLGLDITETPMGTALTVDPAGHTSVSGVWAAGNVANPALRSAKPPPAGPRRDDHEHRTDLPGRRPRRPGNGERLMNAIIPAIRVDVWSDVQCIWCYISSARLRNAIAQHPSPVEVYYHSFQLTPGAPVDIDRDAHIRSHNVDPDRMQQIMTQLRQLTAEEGLAYDPDRTRPTNSRQALELLHHAGTLGRRAELTDRLFQAYFAEGRHVGHIDDLVAIAAEAGLDPEEARTALTESRHDVDVDVDVQQAQNLGARGVPFYVIDNSWGLSGAQPVQQFLAAFEQADRG